MLVIGLDREGILAPERLVLYLRKPRHKRREVATRLPRHGVAIEQRDGMVARHLLTGVDERRPLEEVHERRQVLKREPTPEPTCDARGVVILQIAQLVEATRIGVFLKIDQIEIMG